MAECAQLLYYQPNASRLRQGNERQTDRQTESERQSGNRERERDRERDRQRREGGGGGGKKERLKRLTELYYSVKVTCP